MLHRRLMDLDPGLSKGFVEGIAALSASRSALGTDEEVRAELERLKDFLAYEVEEFKAGRLSSEQLNRQFEGILVSLHGLYRHFQLAGETVRAHRDLALSDQAILEQGVLRLLEDVKAYKLLKLNPTWNDVRLVTFRDGRNESPSRLKAEVDPKSRRLRQKAVRRSRLNERTGTVKPTATVKILSDGVSGGGRKDHGPERAIDPDPMTFWAEVLFADRPIRTTYSGTDYDGFMAQLTVDLHQLEFLNLIECLPFGLYQIRIVALETSTDGVTFTSVSGFSEPKASLAWYSIHFDPVPARYLRVTLLQENFRRQIYHIPRSSILNHQLLDHLADDELRLNLGGRTDSEVEKRLSEFDQDTRILLDGIGKLDRKVLEVVAPRGEAVGPVERLKLEVLPLLSDAPAGLELLKEGEKKPEELLEFQKAEYILGLMHLEALLVEFFPESYYETPRFDFDGTLFEVALESDEKVVSLTDAAGTSFPAATVDYELEIAPHRTKPLVPWKKTTLEEVVQVDPATRVGFVRFSTATSAPLVWRDGIRLSDGDFTFTAASKKLEVKAPAFVLGARYLIRYTPTAGQDKVDILASFSSLKPRRPESFSGTDSDGRLRLSAPPFIDYAILNDEALFYKPSREARWLYRRSAAQKLIDGRVYGLAETRLSTAMGTVDVTIFVSSVSGFYAPGATNPSGELRIEDEIVTYTGVSGSTFTGIKRGQKGTQAKSHAISTVLTSTANVVYEPLEVFVDGIRARNLSDYEKGEHPAFGPERRETRVHSYIQAGPNLYFASPLRDRSIAVHYSVLAEYIKVRAAIRSTIPVRHAHTAELVEIRVLMDRGEI